MAERIVYFTNLIWLNLRPFLFFRTDHNFEGPETLCGLLFHVAGKT
jgi:hypothetical protein